MTGFETEYDQPDFYSLAELANGMVYKLPGCSDMMIRASIIETYREFCQQTLCLRSYYCCDTDRLCIPVPVRYGGIVDSVTCVKVNGNILTQHRDYMIKNGESPSVILRDFFKVNDEAAKKFPEFADKEKNHVEIYSVEIPKIGEEKAPSWFYHKYSDAIISGALSNLFAMQGRPWSDPVQSQKELIKYSNHLSTSRARTADGENSQFGTAHINPISMEDML